MKFAKRIALVAVALLIVLLLVVYFSLNNVVRSAIQSQSSDSLGVKTELDSAKVAVFGGSLGLTNFAIASPSGFGSDYMLTLDGARVQVNLSQLRQEPIHIAEMTLEKPSLVSRWPLRTFSGR